MSAVSEATRSLPTTGLDAPAARVIAERYPLHFMRHYSFWKLRTDPLYPGVLQQISHSTADDLVDVGCGAGLFASFLRQNHYRGAIHGFDLDEPKIELARQIGETHGLDITFDVGDLATWTRGDHQGHITLLDVLQYVPLEGQDRVLREAAACLKERSHRLVLRNAIRDESFRSRITVATDFFAHWVRWMQSQPTAYPSRDSIRRTLQDCDLEVSFLPMWGSTPFNNYLIVARLR